MSNSKGFTLAHVLHDFLLVAPSEGCLVSEYVLGGIVVVDETVYVLDVVPYSDLEQSFIPETTHIGNVVLCFLKLSSDPPVRVDALASSGLIARLCLNELAPL